MKLMLSVLFGTLRLNIFKVDSGCVCAAPGPYPSGQVCCRTAALTGNAAAAPGSSQTYSPTVRSLLHITSTQKKFNQVGQNWQICIKKVFYSWEQYTLRQIKKMYLQFSLQSDRPLTKPLSSQMSNSCFLDIKTTHGDEICMLEIYAEYVMLRLWGSHLKGMWEQHRSLWGSVTAHWSLHCLSLAAITCPPKQHSSVNITCFTRKQ